MQINDYHQIGILKMLLLHWELNNTWNLIIQIFLHIWYDSLQTNDYYQTFTNESNFSFK